MKYIFVHCTAVSHAWSEDQAVQTNNYHKALWNFKSSLGYYGGYNYEISGTGRVTQFRKEGEETAAVIGYNKNAIHICLDGDFDMEMPTQEQINVLSKMLIEISLRYSIPLSNVLPHRAKASYKTCYGSKLSDTWAQELITNYKGNEFGDREH